jgi:hypothetical protein
MTSFSYFASAGAAAQCALSRQSLGWLKTHARFGVPVWAVCQNCDHSRLLDAADLLAMVKPNTTQVAELEGRLRCRACQGKSCELRAATPVPEYCS